MEWKDIIPVLAGALVILVVALVVKPPLPAGSVSDPGPTPPVYVPPTPVPTATPFPEDGPVYTRNIRWTAIDGGVHTTEVRVPEALFLEHRETPRFADKLAWGRYALAEEDRPVLEDVARQIAPPTGNPEAEYFRLMNAVFFVQQIPYGRDESTESYTEGALPRYAMHVKNGVEYPKYPSETLIDGKGDCEDLAILMAGLLDTLGYETVLLRYPDHMALGVRMKGFSPYYAKYTPKYFEYGGKHYYYVEGTGFAWENVSSDSPARQGRPYSIGDTATPGIQSVVSGTPEIIPLRYIPTPAEYCIHPARLPGGGA